jgi:hypothetical protein
VDGVDGDLALLVAEHHGAQHHVFGQLLRFGLDHQHGGSVPATTRSIWLLLRGSARVQHVLAVDVAHARGADRAVERDAAIASAALVAIMAAMSASTSGFSETVWMTTCTSLKKPSGNSGRIGRSIRRLVSVSSSLGGLALEEAAGDLAGGVGLLDVVDGQREEVLARLGVLLATTVASTTVSSMLTSTAPAAWRAISPVSMVTVLSPHWKVLVTLLNMLMVAPD